MHRLAIPVLGLVLVVGSCVATNPHLQSVPVATNGPKACLADAEWTAQTERVAHSQTNLTQRTGERLACDVARMRLAKRSASVCQTTFGSRADIRSLTAATQFAGAGSGCNCLDYGLWTRCEAAGDAICSFEAAVPTTGSCVP